VLWTIVIGVGFGARALLGRGRAGVRSFVDAQLWSIWITFIAAVSLVAILNHAMGLKAVFLGPVIGVLMAVAFASMGSLMHRRWFAIAGVFTVTAIAMALFPAAQFVILGAVWGLAQVAIDANARDGATRSTSTPGRSVAARRVASRRVASRLDSVLHVPRCGYRWRPLVREPIA